MKTLLLTLIKVLISNTKNFGDPNLEVKIKSLAEASFIIALPVAILDDFELWIIDNYLYVTGVLIAIAIDHALGTVKHLVFRTFSIKKNLSGLLIKITFVVFGGILFEFMSIIVHKDIFIKDYLMIVCRLMVFLYPAGSAFMSMNKLTNGIFPPTSWIDRINNITQNLKLF